MKIAFYSTESYDRIYFNQHNNSNYSIDYFDTSLNEESVSLAANHDIICGFVNDKFNATVIKVLAGMGVKLIALRCAGFNNVDLVAAKANEISVVHVPAYSPHAVAEHTIGLILTLNRKLHKSYNRVREGNFSLTGLVGFDLYQKTVGIIGCGNIGKIVAKILLGFGCNILLNSLETDSELVNAGAKFVSKEAIFANADIISLHCPLNPKTWHLINDETIESMKDGVFIVNTSRGGLIDTQAVKTALQSGKISYLAIDVYEQEEQLFFHDLSNSIITDDLILELMMYPNVLITAHQGFLTDEALNKIATTTLANIHDFLLGKITNQVILDLSMVNN